MAKVTKKQAQELHKALQERGIVSGRYESDYGPLNVKIDIEPRSEVLTVFCRFEDNTSLPSDANPHSGKWNFHNWASEAETFPYLVEGGLKRIGAL